jgi:hypothetical protein
VHLGRGCEQPKTARRRKKTDRHCFCGATPPVQAPRVTRGTNERKAATGRNFVESQEVWFFLGRCDGFSQRARGRLLVTAVQGYPHSSACRCGLISHSFECSAIARSPGAAIAYQFSQSSCYPLGRDRATASLGWASGELEPLVDDEPSADEQIRRSRRPPEPIQRI